MIKSTQKLLQFFSNNNINIPTTTYDKEFYKLIKKLWVKTDDKINLISTSKIDKVNDKEYPLAYQMMSKKYEYKDFLSWYRKNSSEIHLQDILQNHKLFHDKNREKLNELLYDNNFISLDVIHNGETNDLIFEIYEDENTKINLYYLKEKDNKPDVKLIMKIINLFRLLTKNNLEINLTLFCSNSKRNLPFVDDFFNPENINAGLSYLENYVYVWRTEEMYKVLIHEMIHYFKLDFCDYENEILTDIRKKIITIEGKDVVNEAYTEIIAVIINSVVYSILKNIDYDTVINYEIVFTHFQIAKIIHFFKGDSYDDLFKINIKQTTSLTSYIIVKGMLLNNVGMVLNHLNKYLDKNRKERYDNYVEMYKNVVSKNSLNDTLITLFLKIIKQQKTDNFVFNTIKMTIMEI